MVHAELEPVIAELGAITTRMAERIAWRWSRGSPSGLPTGQCPWHVGWASRSPATAPLDCCGVNATDLVLPEYFEKPESPASAGPDQRASSPYPAILLRPVPLA